MKKLILNPEQVIVPGEYELGSEAILKIYFRVFSRGLGGYLPPVIVAHRDFVDMSLNLGELDISHINYGNRKTFYNNFNRILQRAYDAGAEYFLLDGNHKSVSATLAGEPLSALEVQVDEDIHKVKRMVETGELFDWPISGETIDDIHAQLKDHLKYYLSHVQGIHLPGKTIDSIPLTVKERVDLLVSNGDLPHYMIERYSK